MSGKKVIVNEAKVVQRIPNSNDYPSYFLRDITAPTIAARMPVGDGHTLILVYQGTGKHNGCYYAYVDLNERTKREHGAGLRTLQERDFLRYEDATHCRRSLAAQVIAAGANHKHFADTWNRVESEFLPVQQAPVVEL